MKKPDVLHMVRTDEPVWVCHLNFQLTTDSFDNVDTECLYFK